MKAESQLPIPKESSQLSETGTATLGLEAQLQALRVPARRSVSRKLEPGRHSHHGLHESAKAPELHESAQLTLLQNSTRGLGHESYVVSGRSETSVGMVVTWRVFRTQKDVATVDVHAQ